MENQNFLTVDFSEVDPNLRNWVVSKYFILTGQRFFKIMDICFNDVKDNPF